MESHAETQRRKVEKAGDGVNKAHSATRTVVAFFVTWVLFTTIFLNVGFATGVAVFPGFIYAVGLFVGTYVVVVGVPAYLLTLGTQARFFSHFLYAGIVASLPPAVVLAFSGLWWLSAGALVARITAAGTFYRLTVPASIAR